MSLEAMGRWLVTYEVRVSETRSNGASLDAAKSHLTSMAGSLVKRPRPNGHMRWIGSYWIHQRLSVQTTVTTIYRVILVDHNRLDLCLEASVGQSEY
jgi:hypothetical protein